VEAAAQCPRGKTFTVAEAADRARVGAQPPTVFPECGDSGVHASLYAVTEVEKRASALHWSPRLHDNRLRAVIEASDQS